MKDPGHRFRNQERNLLRVLAALRPHWYRDPNLPARIQSVLAANRAFGARDRRLYRELVYTALRYLPWIEPLLNKSPEEATATIAWLAPDGATTAGFRDGLTSGWPPCPDSVLEKAAVLSKRSGGECAPEPPLPPWFRSHCPALFDPPDLDAILNRAPLWLRLQTDNEAALISELESRGWNPVLSPALAVAVRINNDADVTSCDAFQKGEIEIQDLGSQMLLHAAGVEPGAQWLDACAGAGGKSLQLARLLGRKGKVVAHDVRPAALAELSRRARRAGVPMQLEGPGSRAHILSQPNESRFAPIECTTSSPEGEFDAVLVDAPCSGSGTWRRAPHLKWTTTPERIADAVARQGQLLEHFASHVRPGGKLIYATCSLSRLENEEVVESFLSASGKFKPATLAMTFGFQPGRLGGITLLPAMHDTDGFHVCVLERSVRQA